MTRVALPLEVAGKELDYAEILANASPIVAAVGSEAAISGLTVDVPLLPYPVRLLGHVPLLAGNGAVNVFLYITTSAGVKKGFWGGSIVANGWATAKPEARIPANTPAATYQVRGSRQGSVGITPTASADGPASLRWVPI
jgi:hypothetical protein